MPFRPPSAGKFRPKAGKTMLASCVGRALAIFAEAGQRASEAGQKVAAQVFAALWVKALCERNLSADKHFVSFVLQKKKGPAPSGSNVHSKQPIIPITIFASKRGQPRYAVNKFPQIGYNFPDCFLP
jgi:hypothetical protein